MKHLLLAARTAMCRVFGHLVPTICSGHLTCPRCDRTWHYRSS